MTLKSFLSPSKMSISALAEVQPAGLCYYSSYGQAISTHGILKAANPARKVL